MTLSPFKANMDISDVLLPIAPFTETAGSFVNAEARLQSFHAVVKPCSETRPAWKVIRVLGSMLSLPGMEFSSVTEVLAAALPGVASGQCVDSTRLSNFSAVATDLENATDRPCTQASTSWTRWCGALLHCSSLQMRVRLCTLGRHRHD